jgi:hypothetical protein
MMLGLFRDPTTGIHGKEYPAYDQPILTGKVAP